MMKFEVVEGRPHHCGAMFRKLRLEHKAAIAAIGVNPHRELRSVFDRSSFRRAWLVDGNLAGLGGVIGTICESSGYVWLALSQQATRHPVAIVKEVKRQLDEIMTIKRELVTTVLHDDIAARRFAVFLGFHVDHADGAPATTRMTRKRLERFIETDTTLHIPARVGFATAMGYHELAA